MITAHSGIDGTSPNSMDYFHHAVTFPVDAIEFDVRCQNGKLVVTHDAEKTNGVLKLEKVLAFLLAYPHKLNIDLKEPGLENAVLHTIDDLHFPVDRIMFSGSITEPDTFQQKYPRIPVLLNPEIIMPDFYGHATTVEFQEILKYCKQFGYPVLNMNHQFITNEMIAMAREADIKLSLWTIRDKKDFQTLTACNPYNLTIMDSSFLLTEVI